MMKFFALAALAILPACGDAEGAAGGGAEGLPSSTTGVVNGTNLTYVGKVTSTSPVLPPTGTCPIPGIAMQLPDITVGGKKVSPLPSPMKYLVATSTVLFCTWGEAEGAGTTINLDFSQGVLGGLTCQELVSDTPEALKRIPSLAYPMVPGSDECCELVRPNGDGYFQTEGVACGDGTGTSTTLYPQDTPVTSIPISGALCSVTGEFMGWACSVDR